MAPPATRVYDVAADILAAVVQYHDGTLPSLQFVSAGPPPWDCELVAVHAEVTANYDGDVLIDANSPILPAAAHSLRYGTFVITIVRCVTAVADTSGQKVKLPTEAQRDADAQVLLEDAQRLPNAIIEAERDGALPGCHSTALIDWRSLGPDGGMMAGQLRLRVGLATGI